MKLVIVAVFISFLVAGCVSNEEFAAMRTGNVTIKWFGHSTFEITGKNVRIYTDPFALKDNFTTAEFVLLSHNHFDHCDVNKTENLLKNDSFAQSFGTRIIGPMDCVIKITGLTNSVVPGDYFYYAVYNINFTAVPAYNIDRVYHNGSGVGYVIDIEGKRIYFAGDTDNIPEMRDLRNIDVAILPIGGKYTMDVAQAAEAARVIQPKAVIPMHYNSDDFGITDIRADPFRLRDLLKDAGIQVVVLKRV